MEELKKDTSVTKSVLTTVTNLLSSEDGIKATNFTELQSFTGMVKSVIKYKLLSDKKWFHQL